jgi:hypothetical protein
MTKKEAEEFYHLLSDYLHLKDEHFGMGGPDSPKPKPVILEERVSIKKLNDTQYTIFYYSIGCGARYYYLEVLKEEDELRFEKIEIWALRYPC